MKAIASQIRLQYTESGATEIVLTTPSKLQKEVRELKAITANGKALTVEIKQYRKHRSLNANSYSWVLIDKIAKAVQPPMNEDDVYIEMLRRYGQHEPELVSVVAEASDIIYRATKNHCAEVGESELNGKVFKHFKILKGSSGYDTKEMAIFIDGIVQEAKELDIETLTPAELAGLKEEWGK